MAENKKQELEDLIMDEGMAIIIKGQRMIGIHPDNLENNLKALNNGDLKLDWELMLSRANGTEVVDKDWWEKEGVHDMVRAFMTVKNNKENKVHLLENDNEGFDILVDEEKVAELSHALLFAVVPIVQKRLQQLGATDEEVIQERWNFTAKLRDLKPRNKN